MTVKLAYLIYLHKAFALFEDPKDKRLRVRNPQVYPYQFIIEQSTRRRKIYDTEEGIKNKKNISEIYRLEDADGTEISIQKMIEKYLSNPEICFIGNFEKYQAPIKNISYSKQIILDLQKKLFLSDTFPRHKFTEFAKNQIEDSSINAPEWSEAN